MLPPVAVCQAGVRRGGGLVVATEPALGVQPAGPDPRIMDCRRAVVRPDAFGAGSCGTLGRRRHER